MRIRHKVAGWVLSCTLAVQVLAQGAPLSVGDRAPEFSLPDQEGRVVKLSDFKGKNNVVLAFYVLAFTGG